MKQYVYKLNPSKQRKRQRPWNAMRPSAPHFWSLLSRTCVHIWTKVRENDTHKCVIFVYNPWSYAPMNTKESFYFNLLYKNHNRIWKSMIRKYSFWNSTRSYHKNCVNAIYILYLYAWLLPRIPKFCKY